MFVRATPVPACFLALSIAGCMAHIPVASAQVNSQITAEAFWGRILALLNERDGSITKEQLEQALGARFGTPDHGVDATRYELRADESSFFDAHYIAYNDKYVSPVGAESNGAHTAWYVGWKPDAFRSSGSNQCITANQVRMTLLANGWSSPWKSWGNVSDAARQPRDGELSGRGPRHPDLAPPPPSRNFFRQSDEASGHRDRLPRGRLFSTGDLPESCVTGVEIVAKP